MSRHSTTQQDVRPLMTINDVAHFLSISRDSVYRLVRAEKLPHVLVGDRIRIRPEDIDAYLERPRP